ncbi:hypothetical protein [Rhizobium sp. RHZ01]|nr:hypothetical protein [Rhizobium sp. RHZ01]MBD9445734.1 hypothetical protein [Rhizobium sp. RHZ01]
MITATTPFFFSSPAQAFVDPVTVGMGISVVQGIVSMGNKGPDLNLEATLASLEMLRAVHKRLNGIEKGIETIIVLVQDLPEQTREIMNEDRDISRSETVFGQLDTMHGLIDSLKRAKAEGKKARASQLQADIRTLMLNLRSERNALFRRSDFVVPTISSAMLIEIAAARSINEPDEEISVIVSEYDQRFRLAEGATVGSLVSIRGQLEGTQSAEEKLIMERVSGKKDSVIEDGSYPWMSFVRTVTTRERGKVDCGEPRSGLRVDRPLDGPLPGIDCTGDIDVTRRVEHQSWSRALKKVPIEAGDLFKIELTEDGGQVIAGDLPGAPGTPDINDASKQHRTDHETLLKEVNQFNLRAEAIQGLRGLEAVVSLSRALAANWDSGLASNLADLLADTNAPKSSLNKIAQIDREIASVKAISVMEQNREDAWEAIAEADAKLQDAIQRAKAEGWRADVLMGLQVLDLSLKTYQLVDGLLSVPESAKFTSKPRVSTKSKKERAQMVQSPQPRNDRSNRLTTIAYINQILLAGDKTPASAWEKLPDNPTPQEARLIEAIALLDTMDAATAYGNVSSTSDADLFAKGVSKVKEMDFWGALLVSVTPSEADAAELDTWRTRNELRRKVNAQLLDYKAKRITQAH